MADPIVQDEHSRSVDSLLGRKADLADSRSTREVEDSKRGEPYEQGGYDWYDVPVYHPITGVIVSWEKKLIGPTNKDGGGSASGSSWSGTYVNDALSAASQAITSFLTGQSLADGRKLAAAEQFQKMAMWALPAGSLPGGFEEGGAMHSLAARKGRSAYMAPPRDSQHVNPGDLINPGQVPPEIMGFIDQIIDAGNSGGKVVSTGGSSSSSG